MEVELKAIKFNHDLNLANTGAINLRRNETQIVKVPEWRPETCNDAECSPVAYTTFSMPKKVTIQASFIAKGQFNAALMIRAKADPAHILGDVAQHPIPLGTSGYILLDLPEAKLANAPIGIHDIKWRWQFSETPDLPDSWTDFQITKHRIYTILSKPTCPWDPESSETTNIHQPWTEVLEYACRWALEAQGPKHDLAATYVTKRFYELGKTLVKYSGGTSYANERFNCSKFLALLASGIGNGQTVNCDDCATVISTFANILGCDLSQSSMGLYFKTNRILLIGNTKWDCKTFFHHAVAWEGDCGATDEVFDGCLQIDNDGSPNIPPEEALQPTNLLFGEPADKTYQFCLVNADTKCVPIPDEPQLGRRRRKLGKGYLGDAAITNKERLDILHRVFSFESWPATKPEPELGRKELGDLFQQGFPSIDWQVHSFEHTSDERFSNLIQTILTRPNGPTEELLNINLYECSDSSDPNTNLLDILGVFQEFKLKTFHEPLVGVVAFKDNNNVTIVFRRGRILVVVRSAGRRDVSVLDIARVLDSHLLEAISSSVNGPLAQVKIDNSKGKNMAHKLADLKRSFRVNPKVTPPFAEEGFLDLSKMNNDGVLVDGRHVVKATGEFFEISGNATKVGNQTFLTFKHNNGTGRFEGVMTYDKDGAIVVTGSFFTITPGIDDAAITAQVEDPWVITKP